MVQQVVQQIVQQIVQLVVQQVDRIKFGFRRWPYSTPIF
jgi:hypothetical protein